MSDDMKLHSVMYDAAGNLSGHPLLDRARALAEQFEATFGGRQVW